MDYSYFIALVFFLSSAHVGFPGCYLGLMKRGNKSTVVWWTPLAVTRSRKRSNTRRKACRRKGKTSPLFHLMSIRSVSCLHWIAISWHVQVRVGAGFTTRSFVRSFGPDPKRCLFQINGLNRLTKRN